MVPIEQDLDEAQWEIQAKPSPDNKVREMSRKAQFMTPKARPDDFAFGPGVGQLAVRGRGELPDAASEAFHRFVVQIILLVQEALRGDLCKIRRKTDGQCLMDRTGPPLTSAPSGSTILPPS